MLMYRMHIYIYVCVCVCVCVCIYIYIYMLIYLKLVRKKRKHSFLIPVILIKPLLVFQRTISFYLFMENFVKA